MTNPESNCSNQQIIQARVLVVDDDPILRTQLKHLARKFVSEIEVAADGQEGLELWRQWQPNVIVTDIWIDVNRKKNELYKFRDG